MQNVQHESVHTLGAFSCGDEIAQSNWEMAREFLHAFPRLVWVLLDFLEKIKAHSDMENAKMELDNFLTPNVTATRLIAIEHLPARATGNVTLEQQ